MQIYAKLINVLTVDTGMNTGWAYWSGAEWPNLTGVLRYQAHKHTQTGIQQLAQMYRHFDTLLRALPKVQLVVFEQPQFENSGRGLVAARSGALAKLFGCHYGMCALCIQRGIEVLCIKPNEWKGQMNDNAVAKRVYIALEKRFKKHELDAVGMGLALMRKL